MSKTKRKPALRQAVVRLNFDIKPGKRMDENEWEWLANWLIGTFENACHANMEQDGFPRALEHLPPIVTCETVVTRPAH